MLSRQLKRKDTSRENHDLHLPFQLGPVQLSGSSFGIWTLVFVRVSLLKSSCIVIIWKSFFFISKHWTWPQTYKQPQQQTKHIKETNTTETNEPSKKELIFWCGGLLLLREFYRHSFTLLPWGRIVVAPRVGWVRVCVTHITSTLDTHPPAY